MEKYLIGDSLKNNFRQNGSTKNTLNKNTIKHTLNLYDGLMLNMKKLMFLCLQNETNHGKVGMKLKKKEKKKKAKTQIADLKSLC